MPAPLSSLAADLRAEGGLLADAVREPRPGADEHLGHAAPPTHAVLVEAIREGELLHYGGARIVDEADPDLALLAGDRLYALGLDRLAALGDLDGVAVLADLISAVARAQAEGRPEAAEAAWRDGVARLRADVAPES